MSNSETTAFPVPIPPLRDVQRWMAFFGWQGDPAVGFDYKRDAQGQKIARHHDATWHADVEESTRLAAKDEAKTTKTFRGRLLSGSAFPTVAQPNKGIATTDTLSVARREAGLIGKQTFTQRGGVVVLPPGRSIV